MSITNLIQPTTEEKERRGAIVALLLQCIDRNETIKLPPFDPTLSRPSDQFALLSVGLEPNDFSGSVGPFRYQFEGEEDLLHLIVTHREGLPVTAEEGQAVAGFVLAGVSPALIWLRPGNFSQHFYVGHDELPGNLIL
jgi:hypothetical protein